MATQYSTLLKLALPTQGELSGSWGDVVNNNVTSMIEEAVAGLKTIDTWSTNSATLSTANGTTAESRAAILNLTDTTTDLSGAATLICPALSKVYIVKNATGQAVTIKTSSGSGIAIPNGTTGFVYCDGTNVVESLNNVTGNLTVGGNASIGGNLTVTGTTTLNGGTLTLGDAASDNVVFGANVDSHIIPDDDDTYDLGSSTQQWRNLYVDGTAEIDTLAIDGTTVTASAADINLIDGITNGTVIASKAIITDSDKDISGGRNITISGELDAGSLDISGNADIDGTTNLDAVDIDGAVQIDNTVTVGADDQGYDVIFYGDTASANMTWDTSVDDLILNGAARIVVPDGQLVLGSTAVSSTAAELNILDGKSFVDEDNMASDSATAIASQQSIKAYVTSSISAIDQTMGSGFVLEDDDGTEVTITESKEVKIIGSGVTTNWTDTDNGTDGDPYDLTITVDAAQTGITSILATDVKIGEDDQTKIDFETADEIHFYAANVHQVKLVDNAFTPQADSDVDLGASGTYWKDAFIDTVTTTGNVTVGGTLTVNGTTTTVNSTTVTIDDPIFTLGGDSAPGSDDNKDRGIEFRYHDGSAARIGFMGWDDSATGFVFYHTATNSSEVFSGTEAKLIAGELDVSGNIDVDGTTNLDAVDIDGAVQIDNTVTVGVDDTGYDVKFFGATASAYMLWDESADDLILAGAARVVVPDGQLVLGSTAVSSTAAELNIMDGNTSATGTTLADADRLVANDDGTMKQVALTDVKTYLTSAGFSTTDPTALAIALG